MSTIIVLDIETSPAAWDAFDNSQQEYILRGAGTEEEQIKKKGEMALAPLTGMVVCIGIIQFSSDENGDFHQDKKVCLVRSKDDETSLREELDSGLLMIRNSERGMMRDFWAYLRSHYEGSKRPHYVSFNGRGFDFPFLMLRSAALGIRPGVNLMSGSRWNYRDSHTDLLDELTYQFPQQSGATRRFNLDFYTRAFGIHSPKSEGVDGSKVAELYEAEKYADIAEYCLRDVQATWELYQRWSDLLKF